MIKEEQRKALKPIEIRIGTIWWRMWRGHTERPSAVRARLLSRWSLLLPNLGSSESAHVGPARLGAIMISFLSAELREQVVCFLAAFITGLSDATLWLQYLAIWRKLTALSLINQRSRGMDDCEGCKRSHNFLGRARRRGTGVQCAERGLRKHSVEPPLLSFLLVNPF